MFSELWLLLLSASLGFIVGLQSPENTKIVSDLEQHEVVAEQSALMEPLHISALNIQPVMIDEWRNIDANTFTNDLSYTPAESKAIYYFDADGNTTESALAGGFYREILGVNAEGQTIAQDFYQDSQTPQTAPFILREGYEKNFSTDGNDGRIIWYTPEGKVSMLRVFEQGEPKGWSWHKLEQGEVRINEASGIVVFYDTNGELLAHINSQTGDYVGYYPHGQSMFVVLANDKTDKDYAWNESGEPMPMVAVVDEMKNRYSLILNMLEELSDE
ncbi:MAG: hypothetical protein Q4B71_07960 [Cardiobacteriaceae bacterium]|nr:hypothetical protein [Cardiobacteriaceae bacterium]